MKGLLAAALVVAVALSLVAVYVGRRKGRRFARRAAPRAIVALGQALAAMPAVPGGWAFADEPPSPAPPEGADPPGQPAPGHGPAGGDGEPEPRPAADAEATPHGEGGTQEPGEDPEAGREGGHRRHCLPTDLCEAQQASAAGGATGVPLPADEEREWVTVGADPLVKAEVVVGEQSRQVLQEGTLTLPLRAIKIREIVGRVVDTRCKLLQDKVIVQAVVEKQIFFVGEDNLVHHVSERVPLSTFLEIPGTTPDLICQVRVTVEQILHTFEPPTTLHQKVLVLVFAKVTRLEHVNLVEQPGGLRIKTLRVIADVTGQLVQEIPVTLAVPAIKVVEVRVSIPAESLTVEAIPDKVILQGIIHKQIFFVDETNVERHQVAEAPFSLFVEAPGTEPGDVVFVTPEVVFESFELLLPSGATSSTDLLEKVVVDFRVDVGRPTILEVLEEPAGTLIKVDVVTGEGTAQLLLERDLTLTVPALKISDVLVRVENLRAASLPGKVLVQGVVHKQLFFIGLDDGLEHHQAELVPFSGVVEVVGADRDMLVQVAPTIEHLQNELVSPTQVHQKVILRLDVVVSELRQVRLATVPYPLAA